MNRWNRAGYDKGADYVSALKANQGTLHGDVALFFEELTSDGAIGQHLGVEPTSKLATSAVEG